MTLMLPPDSELIAGADHASVRDLQIQQLFALYLMPVFVAQRSHNLFRCRVDDVACRCVSVTAVHAETHPAWEIAELHRDSLLRRHCRGVENMNGVVCAIHKP